MGYMMVPTTDDIELVARQVADRFHPDKIVLFGSHAYGRPSPDSDVDLLMVMHTYISNVDQAVEIRKAVDFPFPTDLMVRTPKQVAERLALGDRFLREVLTRGKVLYEGNDPRMD